MLLRRRVEARQRRRENVIRNHLERLRDQSSGAKREKIEKVLNDEYAFEAAVAAVADTAPDDDGDGPLMRLLDWLLNNFDSIFAIITKIITLFGL